MFTIDGLTWDVPCKIERTAEMTASDISGLMLDRSYFNDVLGTYMSYTVSMAVPLDMRDEYAQIYEAITNPVDGHTLVLPYNNGTIEIIARIANISDVYVRLAGGQNYWKGIRFTAIANGPTKEMELGEVIARGMSPLPDVSGPREGDIYIYSNGAWTPYTAPSYADADNMQF